jgi:drug/metabolite transporter (DMT)-like permease
LRVSRIDLLLLLMILIWGTNYSIAKHAFEQIDPQAFNAARMMIGSAVFVALIVWIRRAGARRIAGDGAAGRSRLARIFYTPAPLTRRDWVWLALLGLVGHALYQYLFIGGLARTSVANSSLMLGATPAVIAIITAVLGQDRVGPLHWAGVALSLLGIYVVAGPGARLASEHFTGDLMMAGAVCCWAAYTSASRHVIMRHSPVGVTGISMAIGTVPYVIAVNADVRATAWGSVSGGTWLAIVYSALFSLCVAYTIWYAAVREIGSARTAVYSNLVPLVAMGAAVLFLGEPLSATKLGGAAAVLVGVALTRAGRSQLVLPPEE